MARTIQSSAGEALELTGRLVERFGPRIFGSVSCARAADEIANELGRHCDGVRRERFLARPGAFWHSTKVSSLAYIAGLVLLILGGNWVYFSILTFLIRFFPKLKGPMLSVLWSPPVR